VAVKVLHPTLMAQAALVQRFRREAEVARRIRHPSIVQVLSYGRSQDDGGLHYLVMELLEGEDLEARLERGVDEPNRLAVEVMSALLGALWVAHEAGIVHRDVKPANIFLWRSGQERGIKVLDFGLARDTKDDASLTRTGELVGTPLYMSPEQASGERADARADLYSAGCVAYQLFCGRPPHQKSSPQMTMLAHLDDTPDPPTAVRKELPPSVDRLILRASGPGSPLPIHLY
jgi:serine/threonine-protein kinase